MEDSFVKAAYTAFGLWQGQCQADTMQHPRKGLAIPASDIGTEEWPCSQLADNTDYLKIELEVVRTAKPHPVIFFA